MRLPLNLSPFDNLSYDVFYFVDLFFSGVEGLRILRVQLLETLDSITKKLYGVKLY